MKVEILFNIYFDIKWKSNWISLLCCDKIHEIISLKRWKIYVGSRLQTLSSLSYHLVSDEAEPWLEVRECGRAMKLWILWDPRNRHCRSRNRGHDSLLKEWGLTFYILRFRLQEVPPPPGAALAEDQLFNIQTFGWHFRSKLWWGW